MGFLPGGTADKLGNRYEGGWVVQQLLFVLAERLHSVQLEAIGDAEQGVDLWITRLNGMREAHRCKAFNRTKSTWSIGELKARKVLAKAHEQLESDNRSEFCFVSTLLATELEDLSRSARDASADSESFYEHYVKDKPRAKAFDALCQSLFFNNLKTPLKSSSTTTIRQFALPRFGFASRCGMLIEKMQFDGSCRQKPDQRRRPGGHEDF